VNEKVVRAVVAIDLATFDVLIYLALHILPTVGPEPRLLSRNGDLRAKLDYAILAFDDLHLCSRFVETVATADVSG